LVTSINAQFAVLEFGECRGNGFQINSIAAQQR
jgi:hypothetical protein